MDRYRSTVRRFLLAIGVVCALWLAAVAYARVISPGAGAHAATGTVELTRAEARRLSQLHGTNVIKVERGTVSILRDGRWIPLGRDGRG